MIPADSLLFAPADYRPPLYNNNVNVVPDTTFMLTHYERLNHGPFPDHSYMKPTEDRRSFSTGTSYVEYLKVTNENCQLRRELARLRTELRKREEKENRVVKVSNFPIDNVPPQVMKIPEPTPQYSPTSTISPQDSISNTGGSSPEPSSMPTLNQVLVYQPCVRPEQYPQSILWTLKDCQSDPSLQRASMEKCIRNADGTRISKSQWRTIMDVTLHIVNEELRPLQPQIGLGTRKHYHRFFSAQWAAAVARLEAEVPALALCAGHWKADLTLAQVLDNRRAGEARTARHRRRAQDRPHVSQLGL